MLMLLTKEAHEKNSHPRAGLMTGTSHLADPGKMTQKESEFGPGMAFHRRGWVKGGAWVQLVWEQGKSC
jgi:hypothetical protein